MDSEGTDCTERADSRQHADFGQYGIGGDMTPEQAIEILDEAAAAARLTRREHVMAQQAVILLRRTLSEKRPAPPEAQPDEAGEQSD